MLTFRPAGRADCALILRFIRELAEYERMLPAVSATEQLLEEWLFDKHTAEVLFALLDGREIGYALYFHNFSTFLGKAGLYLEDLYVETEYRGQGIGKAFFQQLAQIAAKRGCDRLDWMCLDWNESSIRFYRSLGAKALEDWTVYRLEGEALQNLGAT